MSGTSPKVTDSRVMNGLHQQLHLHILMTLDNSQGLSVCVSGCVGACVYIGVKV